MLPRAARTRRRNAGQLHAVAALQREIAAADALVRRKYVRDFSEAYRSYEAPLSEAQLAAALDAADVILMGDYHTLPASQLAVAELLRDLAARSPRPLVLGVEMVYARDQHILEEWLRGEISDAELRARIRYELDWGYDWEPFAAVLRAGREHAAAVYGVDCMPRGDMRRIAQRDRHAAAKLAELRARHPEAQLVVMFGESHLAPSHLPAEVKAALPEARILTVLQNIDDLYWRAAGERAPARAVRVAEDVVCLFNSTPLEKYESYRQYIERWRQERPAQLDLAPAVYNLLDALLRFLHVDKYAHNGAQPRYLVDRLPEVYSRALPEQVERVLARRDLTTDAIRRVLRRLDEQGSAYVAEVNSLFLTRYELAPVAGEVARFLHRAASTPPQPLADAPPAVEDLFYAEALEQALADLGARLLCPGLPAARETDLYVLYSQPREVVEEQTLFSYREYMQMVDFLVLHKDYEGHQRHYAAMPALLREGMEFAAERFEFVTRRLGQMLGSELYEAYVTGRVSRRYLRALFFRSLAAPRAARGVYFEAVRRTRPPRRAWLAA